MRQKRKCLIEQRVLKRAQPFLNLPTQPNCVFTIHFAHRLCRGEILRFQNLCREFSDILDLLPQTWFDRNPETPELDLNLAEAIIDSLAFSLLSTKSLEAKKKDRPYLAGCQALDLISAEDGSEEEIKKRLQHWRFRMRSAKGLGITSTFQGNSEAYRVQRDRWEALNATELFFEHTAELPFHLNGSPAYRMMVKGKQERLVETHTVPFLQNVTSYLQSWADQAKNKSFPQYTTGRQGGGAVVISCALCNKSLRYKDCLDPSMTKILPCQHLVHASEGMDCFGQLMSTEEVYCPRCDRKVPKHFEEDREPFKAQWETYQRSLFNLRDFFLDLMTRTVFGGDIAPSEEVIEELLSYTRESDAQRVVGTKELSPAIPDFDTIDASPVIRSFLLQQLLRFGATETNLLHSYYQNCLQLIQRDGDKQAFLLMCIRCVEGALLGREAAFDEEDLCARLIRVVAEVKPTSWARGKTDFVQLGKIRYALSSLAELLAGRKGPWQEAATELETLLSGAEMREPREFFIRSLVLGSGLTEFRQLTEDPHMAWLAKGLKEDKQPLPDAFLVYGNEYSAERTNVQTAIASRTYENGGIVSTTKILATIRVLRDAEAPELEVENAIGLLKVPQDPDPLLAPLIQHAAAIFGSNKRAKKNDSLMAIYELFFTHPELVKDCYLPTMPVDEAAEIQEILRANAKDGFKLDRRARCEKGHVYFIGNCGRPVEEGECPVCHNPIGGEEYNKFQEGNRYVDVAQDLTKTGHCLPPEVEPILVKDRNGFSELSATLIRVSLHTVMLSAAAFHAKEIHYSFTIRGERPKSAETMRTQLRGYINAEVSALSKALGRSRDEIFSLLHILLKAAGEIRSGLRESEEWGSSKAGRIEYENALHVHWIQPTLKAYPALLANLTSAILEDTFSGDNAVLKLVHRTLSGTEEIWAFRRPDTFELLSKKLLTQINSVADQNERDELSLLSYFFENNNLLSALRYLPSILELQKFLVSYFRSTINLSAIATVTIGQFIADEKLAGSREMIRKGVVAFYSAWRICHRHRDSLQVEVDSLYTNEPFKTYQFPDAREIPPDKEETIMNTPLEAILPLPLVKSLCFVGYSVPAALILVQNKFLEATNHVLKIQSSLKKRNVEEAVLRGGILSFRPDVDVLPLLFLHQERQLRVNSQMGGQVSFKLHALQRHLRARVIGCPLYLERRIPMLSTTKDELLAGVQASLVQENQLLPEDERAPPLTLEQREHLVEVMQKDVALFASALGTVELVLRYVNPPLGAYRDIAIGGFAREQKIPANERIMVLDEFDMADIVDVWTTLKVGQALLLASNGLQACPKVHKALAERRKDRSDMLDRLRQSLRVEEGQGIEAPPLMRLLTRFLTLHTSQIQLLLVEARERELQRPLYRVMLEHMSEAEEGMEQARKLPQDVCLEDAVWLWKILADRINTRA